MNAFGRTFNRGRSVGKDTVEITELLPSDAMTLTLLPAFFPVRVLLKYCTTSRSVRLERIKSSCLAGLNEEKEIVFALFWRQKIRMARQSPLKTLLLSVTRGKPRRGCPGQFCFGMGSLPVVVRQDVC